jgi:hypothetical protein
MRTRRTCGGREGRLVAVPAGWLTAFCCMAAGACAAAEHQPSGPPPEYIPPRVLPWDAGSSAEPQDPFAAAAAGDWLPRQELQGDAGTGALSFPDAGDVDGAARSAAEAGPEVPDGVGSPMPRTDTVDAPPGGASPARPTPDGRR